MERVLKIYVVGMLVILTLSFIPNVIMPSYFGFLCSGFNIGLMIGFLLRGLGR